MDKKVLAVRSSIIGLVCKVLATLLSFFCRKVFLNYLGADLLGVNGTLTQILETLSLTELGFQTAIIFQLYRPLAEKDYNKISDIMLVLKRIYSAVGVIIFCIGLGIIPILPCLITKVDVSYRTVYTVYLIMLAGTAMSYLLSYNRAMIQADQKVYVNNLIDSFLLIISTALRLIVLIVFRSYVIYAAIGVIKTIATNIGSRYYYKKRYPWIDTNRKIDKPLLRETFSNTKDVFLGKLGGYVYSSTDNLVISALVGTRWVGLVGNYSTITSAIKIVIFGLTGPIQPMLGNYAVTNKKDETEKTMYNYGFIRFCIAVFLLTPTICLSDMFVSLLYGKQYVLNPAIAILLTSDLLIICMQGAVGELIDALGFFKQERNLYLAYAAINLILSCIGAKLWGVVPVFIATVLSQIIGWIWRSIIAYKYYFSSRTGLIRYWKTQLKYLVYFCGNTALSLLLIRCVRFPLNYWGFMLEGFMIEVTSAATFFLSYKKKDEFRYLIMLFQKAVPKRR